MKHTLLISANDTKGLVYNISKILYEAKLNIEKNDEFVDKENGLFFMRTQITGELEPKAILESLTSILPQTASIKLFAQRKKLLVILVTKENHCLGDLLLRYENNELNADIKAIIGNRANLAHLANRFGIPFHWVDSDNKTREQHEKEMREIIDSYTPDYIALAKYMRILSQEFVEHYKDSIINIHHSFLPAFIGANPYKQAYERGVKIIGATAHFVTKHLDEGPIIAQDITKINHTFTWQDMQKAGRDIEKIVFAHALDLVLNDRVFLNNNKTIVF